MAGWNPWYPNAPQYVQPGPWSAYGGPQPQLQAWGGQAYTDAYGVNPPVVSQFSTKHPSLHPILAIDTTELRWDIRRPPSTDILASTFYSTRNLQAKITPTYHFRIISKSFPWTIDVQSPANITCGMVWEALYRCLQEPLADSEWGFIIQDKKLKEKVEAAAKKRSVESGDKRIKRIDYLGDATLFKGLDRDADFEKLRLAPGAPGVPETWVLKVTS